MATKLEIDRKRVLYLPGGIGISRIKINKKCSNTNPVHLIMTPGPTRMDLHKMNRYQKKLQERTSTPVKTALRRLSDILKNLNFSPILEDDNDIRTRTNRYRQPQDNNALTKLGKPFLSSTKLSPSMDNDRLLNAVRLYQQRLGVEVDEKEAEQITSQLLHKNAMVDTFSLS